MEFASFKATIEHAAIASEPIKLKMDSNGMSFEGYPHIHESYEEEGNYVISFDDDSTLVLEIDQMSIKQVGTTHGKCYWLENGSFTIEIEIL